MDEFQEWLYHPQTREYRRRLEDLIIQMQDETSLNMDNPYWTQAQTAMKEGKIEAVKMIIDDLTPENDNKR